MSKGQITSISFFKYVGLKNKFNALKNMGFLPGDLEKAPGLAFSKLMGSGKGNGFSIKPNFNVYAFIGIWNEKKDFEAFYQSKKFYKLNGHAIQHWSVLMSPFQAHGKWDNQNPFQITEKYDGISPIGVITRATIKPKFLYQFWKDVPAVSESIDDKAGRLFSIGIGELPLILQSTFSIWESKKHMEDFAYHSKYHKEVVHKTRKLGWYSEELFARFIILESRGSWEGVSSKAFTTSLEF